jgi:RimJ/RimL family protein N-acetyltransferase
MPSTVLSFLWLLALFLAKVSGFVIQTRRTCCWPKELKVLSMTSAYAGEVGDGTKGLSVISYLPYNTTLPDGTCVQVGPFLESEWNSGMDLMNLIIREGRTWPFDQEFETLDSYQAYFLSHAAFVVRTHPTDDSHDDDEPSDVMGCFYIKPNYPGRCSHICNGGFITTPKYRIRGVGKLMGNMFLRMARDLGYKSAYFNLVFQSNQASVKLWESLGFQRVAVLEKAAALEGIEGLDTAFGYRYDLETLADDYFLG